MPSPSAATVRELALFSIALALLALYLNVAQGASRKCTVRGGVLVLTASLGWACVPAPPPREG